MRVLRIILCVGLLLLAFVPAQAQLSMDKVKNIFGNKKEPSKIPTYLQFLTRNDLRNRTSGSSTEQQVANYMAKQFGALLFKPYLGKYVHPFRIDKKNNLSSDSYIRIFNEDLRVGTDVVIPPFSGAGRYSAQALPEMPEPDNLWFIKFSEVGAALNNKRGNGLEKLHRAAKDAFRQGAEAVMFVNDESPTDDFTNSFLEKKPPLSKPVFLLNHAAYKKYIIEKAQGQDWINVDYDFAKSRRTVEGHNVVGYWQNNAAQTVVICARIDKRAGYNANSSGTAALLYLGDQLSKTRLTKYNYVLVGLSGTADGHLGADAIISKLKLNANNVNCVINIDDIGILDRQNELFVTGVGTSPDWQKVLEPLNKSFKLSQVESPEVGYGNQMSFYKKNIPTINLFTKRKNNMGTNQRDGVKAIAANIGVMLQLIDKLPKFTFTKAKPLPDTRKMNFEVNMGIVPDFAFSGTGLLVGIVRPNSPADFSTVRDGDILIKMGDYDIRDMNDYVRELAKFKKGDRVMITVKRGVSERQMLITFR